MHLTAMPDSQSLYRPKTLLEAESIDWLINGKAILEGIDFALSPQEHVGLIGPNGSGKSSLLKILSFLETPTSGRLTFQGQEIPRPIPLELRRKIAVVFQEPLLFDASVRDNVASGLKIRGLPRKETRNRVRDWLDRFGIAHLSNRHARSLSGGEAQRVSLARAFVLEPDIIFLDEPFSALDAPAKEALVSDLSEIFAKTKTTAVLISHDFNDILRLTERTLILLNGKVAAEGSPGDLLHLPESSPAGKFMDHWRKV